MKNILILFLVSTIVSISPSNAQSVQIYRAGAAVGASHSTLAAAIAAAASGDSLRMSAHTFYEHDVFINKNLVIAGSYAGIDSTTIDAQSLGRVLRSKSRKITLRDLIITNGKATLGDGGGIRIDTFGVLTLTGNTIVRNNVAAQFGGGIMSVSLMTSIDSIILRLQEHAKVTNNKAAGSAGIGINNSSRPKIYLSDNAMVAYNQAIGIYNFVGGLSARVIVVEGIGTEGGVRVMNNSSKHTCGGLSADTLILNGTLTVSNNTADSLGGGIWGIRSIVGNGKMDVHNNSALYGGGAGSMVYDGGFQATINIFNNLAKYGGGVALIDAGSIHYIMFNFNSNMNVYDNVADSVGGGVYFKSTTTTTLITFLYQCNIYNNKANKYNGVYAEGNLLLNFRKNRLFNPSVSGTHQNPEVYLSNNVALEADSCWFGESDTAGLLAKDASSAISMSRWVVCDWVLNNGFPLATWAPNFPLAARFRLSTGVPLPSNSFAMLQGRFSGTLGSFTPALANMKPINEIESRFAVSSVGMASLMGIVDADTFRKSLSVSVGIAEKGFEHLRIYPNPASDYLHIDGAAIGSSIDLYDVFGKLLLHETVTNSVATLNIQSLPVGTYLLSITTKEGEKGVAKLLKE